MKGSSQTENIYGENTYTFYKIQKHMATREACMDQAG